MKEDRLPTTESAHAATVARGRSLLYGLFSQVYLKEPTASLIGFFNSPEASSIIGSLGAGSGSGSVAGACDTEGLEAMEEEFTSLFILPGGVSPYESVRIKGLLCQEPEWKAREFYSRCGLEVPAGTNVFADHIGMELDFMARLAGSESKAAADGDDEGVRKWRLLQEEFFREHLDRWAFGFLDDAIEYSALPFYKGVSLLARDFLALEKKDLLRG